MRASVKLSERNEAFERLEWIDNKIKLTFGMAPTNRVTSEARDLLEKRKQVVEKITSLDGQPWPLPVDIRESKVI